MKSVYIAFAFAAAGACATTTSEPVNEAAARILSEHKRTGDRESCLSSQRISSISAVDERTLLIRTGVNTYYVADLARRCNGVVNGFNRIEYSTSTAQLCRGEILRIVDNSTGMMAGACGMGSFERLEPKTAAN